MSLDILTDLSASRRPRGTPCRIAEMRRDRPDLIEQWDRVMEARRTGATAASHDDIARWFTEHDFPMTRNTPERHQRVSCRWCADGLTA